MAVKCPVTATTGIEVETPFVNCGAVRKYSEWSCDGSTRSQQEETAGRGGEKVARHSETFLDINGEVKTIQEWSHLYGKKVDTVRNRIERGMDPLDALTRPLMKATPKPKPENPKKTCMTCENRNFTSRSHIIGAVYCEYMFWHGHRRPCPPPPSCTAYVKGPYRPLPRVKLHERGWLPQ